MKLEILAQNKAPLLSREEVQARVGFFGTSTPSRKEIRKSLADQLKKDPELIAIKNISTKFGASEAYISVFVYDNKEEMTKIEPESKREKEKPAEDKKEEAKPEEKPAEEKKKEKPAEKPKEEAPKEEKKEEKPAEEKKEEPKAEKKSAEKPKEEKKKEDKKEEKKE